MNDDADVCRLQTQIQTANVNGYESGLTTGIFI